MTITTDFTGTENYAERMAGLEAIHDWWFGAGSFAAAATLDQVRANLNTILVGTTILNRETFATWLSKVNTLNEPTEYAAALTFGEVQSGALWQCTLPASLRAATDGTGEAAIGGTIARINDGSGNALHLTQASTSLRPVRGRRPKMGVRNRLRRSEELGLAGWTTIRCTVAANAGVAPDGTSTADKTVQVSGQTDIGLITQSASYPASTAVVLSIFARAAEKSLLAMGTDAMSVPFGVNSYAYFDLTTGEVGTVAAGLSASIQDVGGGWYRCSIAVTSRASAGNVSLLTGGADTNGSLVVTDTGGIYLWGAQSEQGVAASPYQAVGASSHDITEAGVESVSYAAFDLVDDALTTGAIAGGLIGQAIVAGDGGCYVSDLSVVPGGSIAIGGTSRNWTGAAPGILRAVTGDTGRVLDMMLRAGAYTEDEITRLERYYRAQGGKGLLVPGPEMNPDPDLTTSAGWTLGGGWSLADGVATRTATGAASSIIRPMPGVVPGQPYLAELTVSTVSAGSTSALIDANSAAGYTGVPGVHRVVAISGTSPLIGVIANAAFAGSVSRLSVRRLIPREDL